MSVQQKPIVRTIAATEARVHFGDVLKRVYRGEEQVVIEKDGLAVAAILSNADYEQYRRLLALEQLDQLNRGINRELGSQGITEQDALNELSSIKKQVFAERYGQAKSKRRKAG